MPELLFSVPLLWGLLGPSDDLPSKRSLNRFSQGPQMKAKNQLNRNITLLQEKGFTALATTLKKQYQNLLTEKRDSRLNILKSKEKRLQLKTQLEYWLEKRADDKASPNYSNYINTQLEFESSEIQTLSHQAAQLKAKIKIIRLNYTILKITNQ